MEEAKRAVDRYVVHDRPAPGVNRLTIILDDEKSASKLQRLNDRLVERGLFKEAETVYDVEGGRLRYGFELRAPHTRFKYWRNVFLDEVKKELIRYPVYCHLPRPHLTLVHSH